MLLSPKFNAGRVELQILVDLLQFRIDGARLGVNLSQSLLQVCVGTAGVGGRSASEKEGSGDVYHHRTVCGSRVYCADFGVVVVGCLAYCIFLR